MTIHEYIDAFADCMECVVASGPDGRTITTNDAMARCLRDIQKAHDLGGTIHVIGNGGSAKIAGHTTIDLSKAVGMRAIAHNDDGSLTAFANDEGYPQSYAGQLVPWLGKSAVLIAVSSSGMSDNIIAAAELAHERGAKVVTFTGFDPSNALRKLGHINFYVPSGRYGHVENAHSVFLHYLTDQLADA